MLKLKKDWRRVHAFNASASPHPPALQLNASRIAYIAQIFAHGDVMYPRDELIKVRILHGRLVGQQHGRHGEFRDDAAPGGAAAAADVDLVLVLGDQFLRRALLGVNAD